MKRSQPKSPYLRSICSVALAVAIHGGSLSVSAQTVTLLEDEMTVDPWSECTFVGANINEGIAEDPENFERQLNEEVLSITPVVERFVERSMEHTDLNLRQALGLFSNWYIARLQERNEEDRTERQIIEFIGQALQTTLNYAFPGSGSLAENLRDLGNRVYQTAVNSTSSAEESDPEVFLRELSRRLENSSSSQRSFAIAFFENIHDTQLRELLDEVKIQEVMERRRGRDAGSMVARENQLHFCAEVLFSDIGIFRPEVYPDQLKIQFLTDLIQEVICDEWRNDPTVGTCETRSHRYMIRRSARDIASQLVREAGG